MGNISRANMELWEKKGDWYPPEADYLYPFSLIFLNITTLSQMAKCLQKKKPMSSVLQSS